MIARALSLSTLLAGACVSEDVADPARTEAGEFTQLSSLETACDQLPGEEALVISGIPVRDLVADTLRVDIFDEENPYSSSGQDFEPFDGESYITVAFLNALPGVHTVHLTTANYHQTVGTANNFSTCNADGSTGFFNSSDQESPFHLSLD